MLPTTPEPGSIPALRAAVLRAWRESPTRFTEDANAEEDLRRGGYRDRLFVELAQNAADAAARLGTPGTLRLSLVDGELRAANTGAPVDARGVNALAALRASTKRDTESVGRFGVGFAAVLAVSDSPAVLSTDASVAFSAERTRDAVAGIPELGAQLAERSGDVPILRLPFDADADTVVPQGFDTEVRLPLRSDVDGPALLRSIGGEVPDVLLALPWLARVEVDGRVWHRSEADGRIELTDPDGVRTRWHSHAVAGEFDGATELGIEAARRPGWRCRWVVRIDADDRVIPAGPDVLHAPTPTDERLSLPARLIATVPVDPSRRRVEAGGSVSRVLAEAAAAYPDFVSGVPVSSRVALVPHGGFPLSEVDGELTALVVDALRGRPWLPAADESGALSGACASVLAYESPGLCELLADLIDGMLPAPLCGPVTGRTLRAIGAETVGVSGIVDSVTGIDRPPLWWRSLYAALAELVDEHTVELAELGALPVPGRDGRAVPGARDALLPDSADELMDLLAEADVVGLRLVHRDAVHPLLERLGAKRAGAGELLAAPAVREAVAGSVHDGRSGMDVRTLADALLRLVSEVGPDFSGVDWLGELALPARGGELRPAKELVHPESALLRVFDQDALGEDAPLDVLDSAVAATAPPGATEAVGVLHGFAVLTDEEPVEPDHDLPEEDAWWAMARPGRVLAIRDLDLVDDDRWPEAIRLLATDPDTWRALTEPGGHAPWWISRFALLDGSAPRDRRLPNAGPSNTGPSNTQVLDGLYDALPDLGLTERQLRAAGVRERLGVDDADDVADLLDRLADRQRTLTSGTTARALTAIAESTVDASEVDPPDRVRTLAGTVAVAEDVAVLDAPWVLGVRDPATLLGSDPRHAAALAELLDLPTAIEAVDAAVISEGESVAWSELAAVTAAADALGVAVPADGVLLHDPLTVRIGERNSAEAEERAVQWWFDGRVHAEDSTAGLGRAFAWAAGIWSDRYAVIALIDDPGPVTALG